MADEAEQPLVIPSSLSSSVPELPRLVALLTCSICYELQVHSTSTPCLHTFCSLCIRKYLQFKPQCPTCHGTVYEQNLRSDKTVEDVVQLVRPLVHNLEKLVENRVVKAEKHDDQKENQQPSNLSPPPEPSSLQRSDTLPLSPIKKDNTTNIVVKAANLPTIKVKSESQLLMQPPVLPSRTPCPVCSVPIPNRAIDQHVEKCLSTRKTAPPCRPVKKRSALPKLVYALLKDNELKKKCREFGLNPKGDRKILINRLQKYTLLYNTESQLDKPKSKIEIVMQVEREEKEEKASKVSTPALLQFDRKTESEVIEKKQKQYMKENKDNFADMIKQVKERNKKKKTNKSVEKEGPVECINLIETVENIEDVSGAQEQRKSIEDISEAEYLEPIFDLPGPSTAVTADTAAKVDTNHKYDRPEVNSSTNKRGLPQTLSPSSPPRKLFKSYEGDPPTMTKKPLEMLLQSPVKSTTPSSPPKKLPKSGNKSVYITPKKSELEELARSPMKTQNIFARLTASGDQNKRYSKVSCPVCKVVVTEKFLNIHLDKCLKSGEDPSPVITRTKTKVKSHKKAAKPTVKDYIANIVIDDSEDSEGTLVLNFSDCEDDVFSIQGVPTRVKHVRGVVKPAIVETSDDPEVFVTGNEAGKLDVESGFDQSTEMLKNDVEDVIAVLKSNLDLDDTVPPPSPVYEQYTETMTQGSYVQSQVTGEGSNPDMFASGSEADFEEDKDDLDSSRNLLELEDDIELMVEAALSEDDESELEKAEESQLGKIVQCPPAHEGMNLLEQGVTSQPEKPMSQPEKALKRAFVKIVPVLREDKSSSDSSLTAQPSGSEQEKVEAPLVMSTRRTTRLRSKKKLI